MSMNCMIYANIKKDGKLVKSRCVLNIQNFYEFDEYMHNNFPRIDDAKNIGHEEYLLDLNGLKKFKKITSPLCAVLLEYTKEQLRLYDSESCYPKNSKLRRQVMDGIPLNPIYSNCSFPGRKLLKAYFVISSIVYFLEDNLYEKNDDEIEFVYCSSY